MAGIICKCKVEKVVRVGFDDVFTITMPFYVDLFANYICCTITVKIWIRNKSCFSIQQDRLVKVLSTPRSQ